MILASSVFDFTPHCPGLAAHPAGTDRARRGAAGAAGGPRDAREGRGWLALVGAARRRSAAALSTALHVSISGDGQDRLLWHGRARQDGAAGRSDDPLRRRARHPLLAGLSSSAGASASTASITRCCCCRRFGMMLMASAASLMIVFVGLEVALARPLHPLRLHRRHAPRSQEAGMKYFLLSSFASAFLLYGMALTFGATARPRSPPSATSWRESFSLIERLASAAARRPSA